MDVPRAIVLDFDGVIVESNEAKTRAFEALSALYPAYRQAMMEYHLANFSLPRQAKFEHYVRALMGRPGDARMVRRMARQFSQLVVKLVVACPYVDGAQGFLEEFSQRLPLYLSSVTPQNELRRIVRRRGLAHFFNEVFGDPPRRKSDAIRQVISGNSIAASQLIFVGDSVSDYRAAVETEVEFIGRNSGQPFDGIEIRLFRDLDEIGDEVRRRLSA